MGGLSGYLQYKRAQIEDFRARGTLLDNDRQRKEARGERCNHRKGGMADFKSGYISQGSETADYAVIKHQFYWGDTWVICIRCGKKWKPGMPDYNEALKFPTCNTTSTSTQFRGIDVAAARELTKES
jgi:hypothetical protein